MKTIFITGSNSGIGLATSLYLAKKGFFVYATMRNIKKKPEIFDNFQNIKVLKLDVTNKNNIKNCIKTIMKDHGKIDILINNAAYGIWGALEDIKTAEIKRLFETNFFGIINLTKEIIPIMRGQKDGKIINISSIGGRMAFPVSGAYNSTKFALEAYSEALRFELAPFNLKVVIIEPGMIKTVFRNNIISKVHIEDSPYKTIYKNIQNRHIRPTGSNPNVVARKIYQVIRDKNPKLRYLVGKRARLYIFLRTVLPHKLIEKIVLRILHK